MPVTENLARQTTFELYADGEWVAIRGINNFSPSPSKNDADTTTFDDEGNTSHQTASRGWSATVGGLYQEDPDTGARDPGQLAAEEWARLIGPESVKPFRITSPGGNITTFDATADVSPLGGGNDDPNSWSLTVTRTGAPVYTAAEDAAVLAAPTSVVGTAGDSSATVTFTQAGTGAILYEVTVYDDADTVVATVQSSSKPIYVGGLTNGEDYTAKGRTKNAHGWSALSAESAVFTPSA